MELWAEAARFARGVLEPRWTPLLDWAAAWRFGNRSDREEEARAFLREALGLARRQDAGS